MHKPFGFPDYEINFISSHVRSAVEPGSEQAWLAQLNILNPRHVIIAMVPSHCSFFSGPTGGDGVWLDLGAGWGSLIVASSQDAPTKFCGDCLPYYTTTFIARDSSATGKVAVPAHLDSGFPHITGSGKTPLPLLPVTRGENVGNSIITCRYFIIFFTN